MKICRRSLSISMGLWLGWCAIPAFSQAQEFEVASVRPNAGGGARPEILLRGGRFIATNVTLRALLRFAFGVPDWQILGGPSWLDADRFDVQAKVDDDTVVPGADMMRLVQALLSDRFGVRVHREVRAAPVYDLKLREGGTRMRMSDDQTRPTVDEAIVVSPPPLPPPPPPPPPPPGGGVAPPTRAALPAAVGARERRAVFSQAPQRGALGLTVCRAGFCILGSGVSIPTIAELFAQWLGRPVVDRTGLDRLYEFDLALPLSVLEDSSAFSLAVRDQLGLQLESARGRIEFVVIDSAQKPSEN